MVVGAAFAVYILACLAFVAEGITGLGFMKFNARGLGQPHIAARVPKRHILLLGAMGGGPGWGSRARQLAQAAEPAEADPRAPRGPNVEPGAPLRAPRAQM